MKKICITHKFLLKSGFLVQMNFLARQNFPFFFLTGISNNLLVGNYKEKLRHEANFRGGGNRGKKKKKCRNYRMEVSRKIFLQGFSASNKKGG